MLCQLKLDLSVLKSHFLADKQLDYINRPYESLFKCPSPTMLEPRQRKFH